MESDNGRMSFSIGLNNDHLRDDAQESSRILRSIGKTAEDEGSKIADSFNKALSNIPKIKIDFDTKFESLDQIEALFGQIDEVVALNKQGIRELQAEFDRLGQAANAAMASGKDDELRTLQNKRDEISRLIVMRKKAIDEAQKQADALQKVEIKTNEEVSASERLRTKIRDLTDEAAKLRLAEIEKGKEIDKTKGRYAEIIAELGKLKDVQGDIQKASGILANDENMFAGVISGVSGVSGAFSAAQGAVAMFGGENENLQKIMLKVQSLMSITIGLQQVQQALNKDSAFQVAVVNKVREYWNKLLAIGRGELTKEAIATKVDTSSKKANAVATTTAATANTGLAASLKLVGAAIKSVPIIGWAIAGITTVIAGITTLIALLNRSKKKQKEANEALKEQQEISKGSREEYLKASSQIDEYVKKIDNFSGTKEQEKHLVEELNSKYGAQMGYYKSLAEWKDTLAKKGEAYCEALKQEALAQAYLNKYVEASIALQDAQDAKKVASGRRAKEKAQKEIDRQTADQEKYWSEYQSKMQSADDIRSKNDLGYHADTTKATKATDNAAGELKRAQESYSKSVDAFWKKMKDKAYQYQMAVKSVEIDAMDEGFAKQLATLELQHQQQLDQLKRSREEQIDEIENTERELYKTRHKGSDKGFTFDRSELSTNDKVQAVDMQTIDEEEAANAEYAQKKQQLYKSLLDQYQNYEAQRTAINAKYDADRKALEEAPIDPTAREAAIAQLNKEQSEAIKRINNEEAQSVQQSSSLLVDLFGDATNKTSEQIRKTIDDAEKLLSYLQGSSTEMPVGFTEEQLNSLKSSPEQIKAITDAVANLKDKLKSGNPFETLSDSITKLKDKLKEGGKLGADDFKEMSSAAAGCLQQVREITGAMKELADATGNEGFSKAVEITDGLLGSLDNIASAFAQGGIVGGAIALLKEGISWIAKGLQMHDNALEKSIERQQDKIDALKSSYSDLSDEVDDYYGSDKAQRLEELNANLEKQNELIREQRRLEEEKKKTDKNKLKEYDDASKDVQNKIKDNEELAIDAIFGSSLKSAIENFASAYADAWASGTDRAKSAKDTVQSMMKQMVETSIKGAVQSSKAMEQIRQKLREFYTDGVLTDWEQDYVLNMAEELQKELDDQFAWADKLLKDDAEDTRTATAKGIATASQDSIDELNGRMTAVQGHTFAIAANTTDIKGHTLSITENTKMLLSTANAILRSVLNIEGNTDPLPQRLESIEKGLNNVKSSLSEMANNGVKIK